MTIIAIDGTFSSGKGTLAKRLADHYGFAYLDTGKLYRATAAKVLANNGDLTDAASAAEYASALSLEDLNDPELKSGKIGAAASKVSVHKQVRAALFDFQQNFAKSPGKPYSGAVLDGRDIGTVICPNADVKLYVDAKPEVRAERRHKELLSYGEDKKPKHTLRSLCWRVPWNEPLPAVKRYLFDQNTCEHLAALCPHHTLTHHFKVYAKIPNK